MTNAQHPPLFAMNERNDIVRCLFGYELSGDRRTALVARIDELSQHTQRDPQLAPN